MKLGLTHDDSSTVAGIDRAGVWTGGGKAAVKNLLLTAYKNCPRALPIGTDGCTAAKPGVVVWWEGHGAQASERQGFGGEREREAGAGGVARISNGSFSCGERR